MVSRGVSRGRFFMLNLSREERRVILFLISMALVGLGINFAVKINSRLITVLRADYVTRININQASYAEIVGTQCVSPKLAKNIIAYRDTHDSFRALEELKEIKGIGDYRYEKLKEIFYVE